MKKTLLTFISAALFCTMLTAQVPTTMNYQIMAVNPKTGAIMADKEVAIRMELRKDSKDGTAVWKQDYTATTSKAGVCTLSIDFEDVDWDNGPYFLATIINGEEAGASVVNSVPYALQAKSLEGIVTKKYLIGTWINIDEPYQDIYTFTEDGMVTHTELYNGVVEEFETYTAPYAIDPAGHILIFYEEDGQPNVYINHCHIVSKEQMYFGRSSGIPLFTRQ